MKEIAIPATNPNVSDIGPSATNNAWIIIPKPAITQNIGENNASRNADNAARLSWPVCSMSLIAILYAASI